MKRLVFVAGMLCLLTGCASSIRRDVAMPDVVVKGDNFVVDATKPDDYPGYMAAEGNIYSCRYGIHHLAADEFQPSKALIFQGLLQQAMPEVSEHKVVLDRFDVYHNAKLRVRAQVAPAVGGAVGGVIGTMIQHSLEGPVQGFALQRAFIDDDPLKHRIPDENEVGCEDKQEGSYYASQVGGGVDVVVIWLAFHVDGKPYQFKTYYAFQPDDKAKVTASLQNAMRTSVDGVAKHLRLSMGLAPGFNVSPTATGATETGPSSSQAPAGVTQGAN